MAALLLALVVALALAIALYTTWYLRAEPGAWPRELGERRRALAARLTALAARLPATPRPAVEDATVPGAATVEAALLAGRAGAALAAAEELVAAAPGDAARQLYLARALLLADQPAPAEAAARRAVELGGAGPRLDFTRALAAHRARTARQPSPPGAASPYASLLSPYELFLLELERHRRKGQGAAAMWLGQLGETSVDSDAILAALGAHVETTCDELEVLVAAAERDLTLVEASYHAARLAVKLGLLDPARALFDALAPLMAGSPDAEAFRADLATLRDEAIPAPPAPPLATGRRSVQLKILK